MILEATSLATDVQSYSPLPDFNGFAATFQQPVWEHNSDAIAMMDVEETTAYLKQRFEIAASITADVIGDWDIINDRLWRNNPESRIVVHEYKAKSMKERYERLHPDDRKRFVDSLKNALESNDEKWECEYRYQNGAIHNRFKILNEKSRIIRDNNGTAVRMISVVKDVTEKRMLQQSLQEKKSSWLLQPSKGRRPNARRWPANCTTTLGRCLPCAGFL